MAATVTVTGVAGPAQTVTAQVFTLVSLFSINCVTNILQIYRDQSMGPSPVDIAITAATTITASKSGSTYTLTIS